MLNHMLKLSLKCEGANYTFGVRTRKKYSSVSGQILGPFSFLPFFLSLVTNSSSLTHHNFKRSILSSVLALNPAAFIFAHRKYTSNQPRSYCRSERTTFDRPRCRKIVPFSTRFELANFHSSSILLQITRHV